MPNPYNIWAVEYDGKCMHIKYATRLPRKLKKFIKTIFDVMEDGRNNFVVVSPSFGELTDKWDSSNRE